MYGHVAAPEIQAKLSGCPARAAPERFQCIPRPPAWGARWALTHAPSSRGGPGLGPTDGFRSPNQHPNLEKLEWTWAEGGQEVAGGCMEAAPPTRLERKQ